MPNSVFFVNQKKRNIAQFLLGRRLQRVLYDGICHESEKPLSVLPFAV